eukprot:gene22478-29600_t
MLSKSEHAPVSGTPPLPSYLTKLESIAPVLGKDGSYVGSAKDYEAFQEFKSDLEVATATNWFVASNCTHPVPGGRRLKIKYTCSRGGKPSRETRSNREAETPALTGLLGRTGLEPTTSSAPAIMDTTIQLCLDLAHCGHTLGSASDLMLLRIHPRVEKNIQQVALLGLSQGHLLEVVEEFGNQIRAELGIDTDAMVDTRFHPTEDTISSIKYRALQKQRLHKNGLDRQNVLEYKDVVAGRKVFDAALREFPNIKMLWEFAVLFEQAVGGNEAMTRALHLLDTCTADPDPTQPEADKAVHASTGTAPGAYGHAEAKSKTKHLSLQEREELSIRAVEMAGLHGTPRQLLAAERNHFTRFNTQACGVLPQEARKRAQELSHAAYQEPIKIPRTEGFASVHSAQQWLAAASGPVPPAVAGQAGYPGAAGAGQAGYPSAAGAGQAGYPGAAGAGQAGYPGAAGAGQAGYPGAAGAGQAGYPSAAGAGQAGYPGAAGAGQAGYPGLGQAGYPGAGQASYPGVAGAGQAGYLGAAGAGQAGYPGAGQASYPGAAGAGQAGYPGAAAAGQAGNPGAAAAGQAAYYGAAAAYQYAGYGVQAYPWTEGSTSAPTA